MSIVSILDIPPELIANIFSYLTGVDISNACQACILFNEVGKGDQIWKQRCKLEYGFVRLNQEWKVSYRIIYQKVLHKYGNSVGLWKRTFDPYGGLVDIKFGDSEVIVANEILPPKDYKVRSVVNKRGLFTVSLTANEGVLVQCCKEKNEPHLCDVLQENNNKVIFSCSEREKHVLDFAEWLQELGNRERGEFLDYLLLVQHDLEQKNIGDYKLERLILPQPEADVPVQPGLFKATYGSHGIEILSLYYTDSKNMIEALKIRGDPNVPAGQVSVFVDLQRPMILNKDQQSSFDTLVNIDTPHLPPPTEDEDHPRFQPCVQPVVLPDGCFSEEKCPSKCLYRFHGKGQIAAHGFRNPSKSVGHFMVFDENTCGFLWLQLGSFSLYSRMTELT